MMIAIASACQIPAQQARATGLPVVDAASLTQQITTYFGQYASWIDSSMHYMEVAQHYIKQADFWATQLVKLKNLDFKLFENKFRFKEVADDFGVDANCPGAEGGVSGLLHSALDAITPGDSKDLAVQQNAVCVALVRAENKQYNDTVKYLDYVAESTSEIAKIAHDLMGAIGKSPANATMAGAQIAQQRSNMANAESTWQANYKLSDAHIQMLQRMKRTLSRKALNGTPSPIGTLVNVAALKTALQR